MQRFFTNNKTQNQNGYGEWIKTIARLLSYNKVEMVHKNRNKFSVSISTYYMYVMRILDPEKKEEKMEKDILLFTVIHNCKEIEPFVAH